MSFLNLFQDFCREGVARLEPHKRKITVSVVSFIVLILIFYLTINRAPSQFPEEEIIAIPAGMSIRQAAHFLEDKKVIRSSFWFESIVRILGGETGIYAGEYYFKKRAGLFSITERFMTGTFSLDPIRVTLHEGLTREQMALILSPALPKFDAEEFLEISKEKEGYLFPDTYRFPPNVTARDVARTMEKNFFTKTAEIQGEIEAFGRSLHDVVIMASLLEREARTMETRRTIAGILWKRLEQDMLLQVDAVFVYILGKGSSELTLDDLAIDSPYNTYKYTGLPPTPIANPGLDALRAAVTPIQTDYFYFLSDNEGRMHYAATFDEHKENKVRYLR